MESESHFLFCCCLLLLNEYPNKMLKRKEKTQNLP